MAKLLIAYAIWLFFGLFGLHQFYLGRPKHGLIMMITLGGFGLGWLRDACRLSEYLKQPEYRKPSVKPQSKKSVEGEVCDECSSNGGDGDSSDEDSQKYRDLTNGDKRGACRLLSELVMGLYFPVMYRTALPLSSFGHNSLVFWLSKIPLPIAVAEGILLANGAGRKVTQSRRFTYILSFCSSLIYMWKEEYVLYSLLITCFLSGYLNRFFHSTNKTKTSSNTSNFMFKSLFFMTLGFAINIYWIFIFISEIEVKWNGEMKTLREVVILEQFWQYVLEFISLLYIQYEHIGITGIFNSIVKNIMTPDNTESALQFLNLPAGSSLSEIRRVCRKLSAYHHPDRFDDVSLKAIHEEQFNKIRSYCDVLLKKSAWYF